MGNPLVHGVRLAAVEAHGDVVLCRAMGANGVERFGHGGAFSTDMTIDTARGLVEVWLVQHAGYPGNGAESQGAFERAAQQFKAANR